MSQKVYFSLNLQETMSVTGKVIEAARPPTLLFLERLCFQSIGGIIPDVSCKLLVISSPKHGQVILCDTDADEICIQSG